jgi:hypothetical protein
VPPIVVPPIIPGIPPIVVPPEIVPPGPAKSTDWKPYSYTQPDAGARLGTPYALAGAWHGQGAAWTQMWNLTRGRAMSAAPDKNYAYKGDALLIPYTWPEPTDPAITARCKPIAAGTPLPTLPSERARVSGDDDASTI